ncbi:MAG: hypothetical protein R3C11_13465 [Planctomycetaceae bacterium]
MLTVSFRSLPDEERFITVNQLLEMSGLSEFRAAVMFGSIAGDETINAVL